MNRATPSAGALDVEWIAMQAGLKPGNRVSIAADRAGEVEARARRHGLAVVRGPDGVEFPGRPPVAILYLARDADYARAMAAAEAPLLPPDNRALDRDRELELHTRFGALLGFPACCVAEFCARLRRGITSRPDGSYGHEDFVAAEHASRASRQFLGRLNDLSPDRRARLVTFYPCRYDCEAAAAYAAGVFAAAEALDAVAAAALRAALLGEMRIAADGARGAAPAPGVDALTIDFATF